jgi:hypothetical protein
VALGLTNKTGMGPECVSADACRESPFVSLSGKYSFRHGEFVDSNLERCTLGELRRQQSWFGINKGVRLEIEKPHFDLGEEDDALQPMPHRANRAFQTSFCERRARARAALRRCSWKPWVCRTASRDRNPGAPLLPGIRPVGWRERRASSACTRFGSFRDGCN